MSDNLDVESAERYDVVVIGGGPAGLAGALALVRSRRSVLVVDSGRPRNAPAASAHNYLTRDGAPPTEISNIGREEVMSYGGWVESGEVQALSRVGADFRIELGDRAVAARRLLVATGSVDVLPAVPGLAERWGKDVLHCPYCHGWEVRDRRIGVLATSAMASHQALLFRQLTDRVTVLAPDGLRATPEEREQFAALGISVVDSTVLAVEYDGSGLTGVRLDDGFVALDALAVQSVCHARAELLAPLGLQAQEVMVGDTLFGTQIAADPTGRTEAAGVWVAGNLAAVQAQVISSAASGLTAGAAINADLVSEDARHAVSRSARAARPTVTA